MGFLTNLFTEQDMQDSKELRWLLEADDPEVPEENYEMPDDEEEYRTNNTEEDAPEDTGEEADANYEMPEEEPVQQADTQDTGETTEEPEENYEMPEEEPVTDTQAEPANENPDQGAEDTGEEADTNYEMPDDEGGEQPDQAGNNPEGDTADAGAGGDEPDMPDDDFNLPDEGGDTPEGDTPDAGAGTDDTTAMNTGPDPDQGLKDTENDIFDGLSDQDKQIKINELKDLYEELYNRVTTLSDKVNEIPKSEDLTKVYNFITNNLSDMKQFIYDYMSNMFDNKTYMENLVNYKKYISTLNTINGILEEIRKGEYSTT